MKKTTEGWKEMEEIKDYKLLVDAAVLAGELMLKNGAEIYRVEDTISRMLSRSGLSIRQAYVTSTGFVVTLDDPKVDSMTVVRRVGERNTNLNKISIVNTISRQFCTGEISLKEAFHQLNHMEESLYGQFQKDACTLMVTAAFALLLGSSWRDALGAGAAGVLLVLTGHLGRRIGFTPFLQTLVSSTVIALGAVGLSKVPGTGLNMDMIIIGAIMPILPGAALTTAVRDTLQGDYVAGGAKALEALVKVAAIVIGVGFGISLMGGTSL